MIAPVLLNVVKTSLKSLYDIDPLVVDLMLLSISLQARVATSRTTEILLQAHRSVRSNFSIQSLQTAA